jgi:3-deoxy-D-manno-octulosonic-acid transferase
VLDALRPALLLFSRGDLWPELVTQAAARNVTVAVAGGTVRPRSARLRWPAVWALRRVQRRVAWLGAVSADDADRWRRLGVPPDRIEVTGDPRHDQITERIPDLRPALAWRAAPMAQSLTVVAGSVEPPEDALLAAAAELMGARWRWLVVPHDPDARRLARVQGTFEARRLTVTRWDGSAAPGAAAVTLMTRRGLLADLYWAADVAYVGGAWRRGALHAVCEPAVAGIPVAAGPYLTSVRDGALLAARGAAVAVPSAGVLAAQLDTWASPARRHADGLAARGALETGAAEGTAARLARVAGLLE